MKSPNNPVDILGDASPNDMPRHWKWPRRITNSDGLLVVLTPQAMTDPTATAEALKNYAQSYEKPILASWSGGRDIASGRGHSQQGRHPHLHVS